MVMSDDERQRRHPGPAVNQFGTPVNRFGTPTAPFGSTPPPPPSAGPSPHDGPSGPDPRLAGSLGSSGPVSQFGQAAPFGMPGYAGAQPAWQPPRARRRTPGQLALLIVLICVAVSLGMNLVIRTYVFPDLSKPIELPGSVAGVGSASAGPGQPVTVQSKDEQGRATAVSFYADDDTAPSTVVVVTAGRVKNLRTEQITEPAQTIGKVTCTDNMSAGLLLGQSGAADLQAMRQMTTGAACWRTARHLTVLVVAFTAHEAAQSTARQAVMDSWDAI
jgi:hypothetical protein